MSVRISGGNFLNVERPLIWRGSSVKVGGVLTLESNLLSVEKVLTLWRNLLNLVWILDLSVMWFDCSIVLFDIEVSAMLALEGSQQRRSSLRPHHK